MNKEKEKIKLYAKKIFQTFDSSGKRMYSYRQICTKLNQKFNTTISYGTVKNWSQTPDPNTGKTWESINDEIKIYAVEKLNRKNITAEEQVLDAKSADLAEIYNSAKNLYISGSKMLSERLNNQSIDDKTLVSVVKMSSEILLKFNDPTKNQNNVQISPIITLTPEAVASVKDLLNDC